MGGFSFAIGQQPLHDQRRDADRLDLGRVGITPNAKYLGTKAARTEASMAKANQRAEAWCDAFYERRRRQG